MNRVECLDGLRGLAALWVLLGHAALLTGFKLPLLSQPDLGVDLFILLSGFLMVHQYYIRSSFEDWGQPRTWASFWVRRFFRIAPLFYVALFFSIILGPAIYDDRLAIDTALGRSPQPEERYLDSSITNIVLHVTFLFGLLPSHAYRTPLPDWSLGLEMQFYAVFPAIVLLARKVGWIGGSSLAGIAGVIVAATVAKMGMQFPMPSFLPLKLHVFIAGMLVAAARLRPGRASLLYLAASASFAMLPIGPHKDLLHVLIRGSMLVAFFGLLYGRQYRPGDLLSIVLGGRLLKWLGELSFGAYLIHLLVMQPIAAWVFSYLGPDSTASARFLIVSAVVLPPTYALAAVGYFFVEKPGQSFGKRCIVRLFNAKESAQQTTAEKIAAP
ncbi:acyltransferase family protein [Croceibacterium ferulae]|uniref:acyltransferase family protein n=1 Tax=Croceibacterium ferulae TaxID=1854641 RepID=UPI000EB3B537|nr:acyltransferase [Croceibacterium ferulae]